jgi:hypothetical protein
MKLLDYAGLPGKWPPPGHSLRVPARPAPEGCFDTLLVALHFRGVASPEWDVIILTELYEELFTRRISVGNNIFLARVFAEFLGKQRGKTIQEIGNMDVTFLG